MLKITKQAMVLLLIAMLIVIPFAATASAQSSNQEKDAGVGHMVFDLVLLRPVGILATAIGSALFVVSLPFTAVGGNTKPAYEKMIKEPAKYTFTRPLGRYDK